MMKCRDSLTMNYKALHNQLNKYDEMHNNDKAFDRSIKKENFFTYLHES